MAVVLNSTLNSVERAYDKTKNNIKYGTAAVVAGGTYLAVKNETFRKNAGKGINRTVEWTGSKIVNAFNWLVGKINNKFKGTKVGETFDKYFSKVKNSETAKAAKDNIINTGKKISEQYGKIKASSFGLNVKNILTNAKNKIGEGLNFVGEKLTPLVNKIPKKGILGAIALVAGISLIAISHKHGYNSGKIDQRYEDKQKVINQFQI